MIAKQRLALDVFLSHAAGDRSVADTVSQRLRQAGMSVLPDRAVLTLGKSWEGQLRKALVESDAFVLLVNPQQPVAANSTFELGAVAALGKPVFVVASGAGAIPAYLKRYPSFRSEALDALVLAIEDACAPLGSQQRDSILQIYQQLGIPSDRLISDPLAIEELGNRFRAIERRQIPDGRLAAELLRLRKGRQLPRLRQTANS